MDTIGFNQEGYMENKGEVIRCKKLEHWLDGIQLEEKLKTLEHGRLLTCLCCAFTVFDKEKPENRIKRKCMKGSGDHAFMESEYYIILKRGFAGVIDVVTYYPPETPKDAVLRYYKNTRK